MFHSGPNESGRPVWSVGPKLAGLRSAAGPQHGNVLMPASQDVNVHSARLRKLLASANFGPDSCDLLLATRCSSFKGPGVGEGGINGGDDDTAGPPKHHQK